MLSELIDAMIRRDYTAVRQVLALQGELLAQQTDSIMYPLHYAVLLGDTELVSILLDAGSPVDLFDRIRRTPLYAAVEQNNPEIVKLLLEHHADPNLTTLRNPDYPRDKGIETPLHIAAQNGYLEVIELLLDYGADPMVIDSSERTAESRARQWKEESAADLIARRSSLASGH